MLCVFHYGSLTLLFQVHKFMKFSKSLKSSLFFRTTSGAHFTTDNALKFDPQGQKSLMLSSVPMGDSEMVKIPDSEVRGNFKGQNVDHIKPSR